MKAIFASRVTSRELAGLAAPDDAGVQLVRAEVYAGARRHRALDHGQRNLFGCSRRRPVCAGAARMTSGTTISTTKQRVRRHWPVLAVALAASSCSLVVRDTVFPLYSGNKDEPVYIMQAKTLVDGHVTLPTEGGQTKFIRPWLTGIRNGRIFFVFPAGWPAFLAASQLLFGTMRIGLALLCAATVIAVLSLRSGNHP